MSSPGVSLDNAIAGITRGVENARKVAMEINKKESTGSNANDGGSNASGSADAGTTRLGGSVDVMA